MVHNGLVVDRREPMERAGRFLWLDWSQARLIEKIASPQGDIELLTAEHNGYRSSGIMHRRLVLRAGDKLMLIVDQVRGQGEHEVHLPWLLPMAEWRIDQNHLELDLEGGPIPVAGCWRGFEI